MHIIVYVYKDFASLEKIKMCCRLNKKQNGHLPCLMADVSGYEKSGHPQQDLPITHSILSTSPVGPTLRQCPLPPHKNVFSIKGSHSYQRSDPLDTKTHFMSW